MNISAIQLGHSNNSSSSHSILLNSKRVKSENVGDSEYGWNWFHLTTEGAKRDYLATMLKQCLPSEIQQEFIGPIIESVTGVKLSKDAYIDHQSVLNLPLQYGNKKAINLEFYKELCDYVTKNPKISILGGNDNESCPTSGVKLLQDMQRDGYRSLYARKNGNWWTLYNAYTGSRVRLTFTDEKECKATAPELVDIKITNFCTQGCPFCYMGSTPKGVHASRDNVTQLLYNLAELQVLEVAFGGGEPTQHPDFKSFLFTAKHCGITPNFTTFNMEFTKNKDIVAEVLACCGSFAVSNLSSATIQNIADWNREHEDCRGTLQIPLGAYTEKQIKEAIVGAKNVGVPITLLGYKPIGRGVNFPKYDYSWIPEFLYDQDIYQYGADSKFVEEFRYELLKYSVAPHLMVSAEGKFSCFIDATTDKIAKSSMETTQFPLDLSLFPFND